MFSAFGFCQELHQASEGRAGFPSQKSSVNTKQDINALNSVFVMKVFKTEMQREWYNDPCP